MNTRASRRRRWPTLMTCEFEVAVTVTRNLYTAPPPVEAGSVTTEPAAVSSLMILPSCAASVSVSVPLAATMRADTSVLRSTSVE